MTLPVVLTAGTSAYNIQRSLRFRSSASAYLSRTPASAGNKQIWTLSFWLKTSKSNFDYYIAEASTNSSTDRTPISFNGGKLQIRHIDGSATQFTIETTQVFRDPSSWYHFVIAVDTTQATSTNRVKFYVNGSQITAFGTANYPTQNLNTDWNGANAHSIGSSTTPDSYADMYLTEFYNIDGQQLTPSSFGQTNSATGVWQPAKYTGTYGTNGFYLPFTDTTSTTTISEDFSGNNNDWTSNNISLTSGSTYDSMNDVPTLTSATTANYAVMNPLANPVGTLSSGNLQINTTTDQKVTTATMALPSTGQYYFEVTATDYVFDGGVSLGLVNSPFLTTFPANGNYIGIGTYSGNYNNGTSSDTTNLSGTNVTNDGDIWCIAIDVTNNKFWAGRSRSGTLVWADGVTPAVNGSGASTLSLPTGSLYPMIYRGGSYNEIYNFNFGQQPFAQTPPTGFVALNTFNLPTPDIGATASSQANKYMDISLYTGTGSSQSITGLNFQPDWTWIKGRSGATDHGLYDAVRGVQKQLESNNTDAETTETTGLTAFNSNGFTVGALAQLNTSSATYVGWNWKANGSGSTNTSGSITSTVSANTTAGFSIATFTTPSGYSTGTVGHGLGVTPSMIIVKNRTAPSGANNWNIFHTSIGNTGALYLNTTGATTTSSSFWNDTSPTSSVFTIGSNLYASTDYVAYCFAQIAGYSAFGSFVANGSTDNAFIYTGFRPRFIMAKNITTAGGSWFIRDTARNTYNAATASLWANLSDAENASGSEIDILSNGFKLRSSGFSSDTYIYMAFAENPFKYSLAR